MKKTIITGISNNFVKCAGTFGDGSTGLVFNENQDMAFYDKKNDKFLTPFIKGNFNRGKDTAFIIGDDKKGYIYNFEEKRFVAYDVEILYSNSFGMIAYHDLKNNTYHIISLQEHISEEFTNLEVKNTPDFETLFLVTDEKGKGIYEPTDRGLKLHYPTGTVNELQEVKCNGTNYYVVNTTKGKQGYIYYGNRSDDFDNVKKSGSYFICQDGDTAYVYDTDGEEIFKTKCDELIHAGSTDIVLYFILKRSGKYGVIEYSDEILKESDKKLVPCIYDEIRVEELNGKLKAFYLVKSGKVGLFSKIISNKDKTIKPEYKNIEYLARTVFQFTNFSDNKKIVDIDSMETLVEGIDSLTLSGWHNSIIYEKDGKLGYIDLYGLHPSLICDNMDSIRLIHKENTSYYYEIVRGNNNGILMDSEVVVPIKNGQYIDIFDDCPIFVIYDENGTHVCAYNYLSEKKYNELFTIPQKYRVEYLGMDNNYRHLFEINGITYIYAYPKFKEFTTYYSQYEFENATIINVTSSSKEQRAFEQEMENTPEAEIEKTLVFMNEKYHK